MYCVIMYNTLKFSFRHAEIVIIKGFINSLLFCCRIFANRDQGTFDFGENYPRKGLSL
jgi:hypothetical protein